MTAHVNITIPDIRVTPIQDIKLSDIDIPANRARDLDEAWAEALSLMIAAHGLINPITVRIVNDRKRLVTGLHRHAAFGLLSWETIPVRISNAASDDEARMEEVIENLGRHELKALDRCHHLFELQQVHEKLYPAAKHGGDRKSEIKRQKLPLDPEQTKNAEVFGFSASVAENIGLSDRSIRLAVKIWKDLSDVSRKRCAGTWLADHQAGLKQLAEQSSGDQVKVLDILFAQPPKATNVPDALAIITNGRALTHTERKVAAVSKTLKSLPGANEIVAAQVDARIAELQKSIATMSKFLGGLKDDELDDVVIEHEDRIIASLKRRGRI
ncbi:Nucleoid occlusion protein [Agrobacterium sp. DSM 25558]|uniref:ParB N-terminal domain-containing protein n=1 Tax=Agrobacterium sp. DSM 25558 TaxID=1907665 RepID=UPI00097255C5|nr:ParB N-terminal domain-containing protein [Agrobacterium sp. DSM 25558]SCX30614.1 Nucleoid occlusion protein [Agrobacterium sp. DSM 25558]